MEQSTFEASNRRKCCHEKNSELDTSYDHKNTIFPHFKIHVPQKTALQT